jgi:hypothetical protein
MSDSKIQIKVGIVEFSGEGNQEWLASQLDKILNKIPELLKIELASPVVKELKVNPVKLKENNGSSIKEITLASWLKDKTATTNQTRKFLATAAYLQLNGQERITSGEVKQALSKNSQSALTNPSESLNQNNSKGFCQKDGKSFYITPEGFKELGIDS